MHDATGMKTLCLCDSHWHSPKNVSGRGKVFLADSLVGNGSATCVWLRRLRRADDITLTRSPRKRSSRACLHHATRRLL